MPIRDIFSNSNALKVINKYDKGAVDSVCANLACCSWKGPLKRYFLDIYLTTFSVSVILEIQNLWESYFVPKCSKCNLDFKNAERNWEKVFFFWDNCIWIGIVKLSLLTTGYSSLAANMLANSCKIWHITKRDFLQLNSGVKWGDPGHILESQGKYFCHFHVPFF